MPIKVANNAPNKKERLTLAQLAAYDDILTDALVDHVYYWTTIRKNKIAYHSSRGITEEAVTAILQKRVVIEKNPTKAEFELLELPAMKKFCAGLKTDKEKADFRKHLRRYINIYLPDCPFEVSSTNKYTVVTHEASITARQFIKKGTVVKYLCGVQVMMTDEEEEAIKSSRRDFSIVVSSRKGSTSLFLGPARFANHDCESNARLLTSGSAGMEIVAIADIEVGDEITVSYAENYFGEDNCECLCKTCEDNCRNGWTAREDGDEKAAAPQESIEEVASGYSLRHRRRRESTTSSRNGSMTPEVNIRPRIQKRTPHSLSRFRNAESPLGKSPSMEPSNSPTKRNRDEDVSPSPSSKKARIESIVKAEPSNLSFSITVNELEQHPSSASSSESGNGQTSPSPGPSSTDATSVDEDTITVEQPQIISPTLSRLRHGKAGKKSLLEQAKTGEPILLGASTTSAHPILQDDSDSVLSELPSEIFSDHDNSSIPTPKQSKKRRRSRAVDGTTEGDSEKSQSEAPQKGKKRKPMLELKSDLEFAPKIRIPGDYILTDRLIAEPTAAWINCMNCEEAFVQLNAYFTRSSCPRCERHSKLYGYQWPKTDKGGRDDSEERVLDHRTVHRFIRPNEEKEARKYGRSESRAETREVTEAVEEKEVEQKRSKKRRMNKRVTM